jgi:hypothetical protein
MPKIITGSYNVEAIKLILNDHRTHISIKEFNTIIRDISLKDEMSFNGPRTEIENEIIELVRHFMVFLY